ncbi:hypothetical protein HF888_02400 [Bermanella marisrubri]|uniref:YtkA-like domain-containing protein n=1 Tax=Bermanella marisrubri TaxID=207949 RepID=Q1N3P7_9GAMM|nr:hypothetical protein [Bermanella marisrubri]EAT12827.1 hypothetical protein RED65_12179 [Oceanobacter sp. RED65] [Bermanella marisrubri]QIZ83149.1 hypothetical protein HF888_02400 [Bermanella marisrubri]
MNTKTGLIGLMVAAFLSLTGCGSDDEGNPYSFELELGTVENGVAEVTVSVELTDGTALPNEQIQVSPLMIMTNSVEHGTPFESTTGTLDENGSYTATAYFLMPSNMPSGDPMGDWYIDVTYDGQMQTFPITVEMNSGDVKQLRGGANDQIMSMNGGTVSRNYYVYNRGRHIHEAMGMNNFEVYVAARESMMDYQAVAEGNVLNADSMYELDIASVVVEMCIESCDNETNWKTAMADVENKGVYKGMNLGLAGDETDIINVRLSVNNDQKDNGDSSNPETTVTFTFDGAVDDSMMHPNH